MQRCLDGVTRPKVKYFGLLDNYQKDNISAIEDLVFRHWDNLPTSPPKTKPAPPRPAIDVSGLSILSCDAAGNAGWPDHILEKFPADSPQRKEIEALKQAFVSEFGSRVVQASQGRRDSRAPRVIGEPDFTVEGGKEPLDVQRLVDLEVHDQPPSADQRRRGVRFNINNLLVVGQFFGPCPVIN